MKKENLDIYGLIAGLQIGVVLMSITSEVLYLALGPTVGYAIGFAIGESKDNDGGGPSKPRHGRSR